MTDNTQTLAVTDRIFINGILLTMDKDNTQAEAMIVRNGRIVAVDSSDEIKNQIKDGEGITDLEGKNHVARFYRRPWTFSRPTPTIGATDIAPFSWGKSRQIGKIPPEQPWIWESRLQSVSTRQ